MLILNINSTHCAIHIYISTRMHCLMMNYLSLCLWFLSGFSPHISMSFFPALSIQIKHSIVLSLSYMKCLTLNSKLHHVHRCTCWGWSVIQWMASPLLKMYFLPVEKQWVNTSCSTVSAVTLTRSKTTWRSLNAELYLIMDAEHDSPASLDSSHHSQCISIPDLPLFMSILLST